MISKEQDRRPDVECRQICQKSLIPHHPARTIVWIKNIPNIKIIPLAVITIVAACVWQHVYWSPRVFIRNKTVEEKSRTSCMLENRSPAEEPVSKVKFTSANAFIHDLQIIIWSNLSVREYQKFLIAREDKWRDLLSE